jgi:hypothetical protein
MVDIYLPYKFVPRQYQMRAWKHFEETKEGQRGVCLWHRRAGKDLFAINMITVKAHQRIGTYWHLLPTYKQGRAIVWNGMTRDGRKFMDYIPESLVDHKNSTEMTCYFKNGSIYQVVGTDNVDSLVGTNPVGCVFSEYSLHDPSAWEYIRPILAENGGFALFIYTARGKNHGHRLWKNAERNLAWFNERLIAGNEGTLRPDGTPVISDEIIEEERAAGMPEAMIQQEFFNSFEAPLVGAYYADQMNNAEKDGRIGNVPWEPRLSVDTYWDLGVDDATAIWFVQTFGHEQRIIDYYENSGEGLAHYIKTLRERDYVYGRHFAPWDIEVREFTSGRSRIETARELGIRFTTVSQHSREDGIEAVRNLLPQCWFDEKKCERGIDALKSYRKEFDSKRRVYTNQPVHDWASHGADAFRTFAMGHKRRRKHVNLPQERAIDTYDYLAV